MTDCGCLRRAYGRMSALCQFRFAHCAFGLSRTRRVDTRAPTAARGREVEPQELCGCHASSGDASKRALTHVVRPS
jgi:hypothetical protein